MNTKTDMEYRIFTLPKLRLLFVVMLISLSGFQLAFASAPPPTQLVATADTAYVNGYIGNSNLLQIFANDSFNNAPLTASTVIVTYSSSNAKISLDTATGIVSVSPLLTAGTYSVSYTLKDPFDTTNQTSTNVIIFVSAPAIIANGDAVSAPSFAGASNVINVLSNDSFNAATASIGQAVLSIITNASHAGVTLNASNGLVSVAPFTPAGNYTIQYRICDSLNTSNCDTAIVNINVIAPAIIANGDAVSAPSYAGASNVINVLSNDSLNAATASIGQAVLSIVTNASHAGVTLNISNGLVSVAPFTPAGNYTIQYSICDSLNTSNCDTAIVNINVIAPIILANSDFFTANAYLGGNPIGNIFSNDSLNGAATNIGPVSLSIISPASVAGITLNTSTGAISANPFILAGNYTIVYRICDSLNTSNCDTAIVNIELTAPPIIANTDYVAVNSYNGGNNVINIFSNDSINNIVANSIRTTLTVLSFPSEPNIILNPINGRISVFPFTPAGLYSYTYRLCDTANTSNCDTSIAYVDVIAPPIIANTDFGTVNGYIGQNNVVNVISNDSLNNKSTTLAGIHLSQVSAASHPGVSLNIVNGWVSVAPITPAGTYEIKYRICDTLNSGSCDTGSIFITVTAPTIIANNDNAAVNGYNGNSNAINVFSNDSINNIPATASNTRIGLVTASGHPGILLDTATGIVSVTAPIAIGNFTITYSLCDTLNPSNCDTATITIQILPPVLIANTDTGFVNGFNGSDSLLFVLANDSINGSKATLGSVGITIISAPTHPAISLDTTNGKVIVGKQIPAGDYLIGYKICDTLNNANNCANSFVVVRVTAPPIHATNDTAFVNGYDTTLAIINVLNNDSLNNDTIGLKAVLLDVYSNMPNGKIFLDTATGNVSVFPRLAAGEYAFKYAIYDTLNPSSFDTAFVVIYVDSPAIIANDDYAMVNGYDGDTALIQVLNNDSINAKPIAIGGVKMSVISPSGNSGVWLNDTTGFIYVAPLTPSGIYTISYKICDTLNVSNCDSAIDSIWVTDPSIEAVADTFYLNGYDTAALFGNVLSNDSINHKSVSVNGIKLRTLIAAGNPNITLNDTTGFLSLLPRTAAGTYSIQYSIADTLNPNNRDTNWAVIQVLAPQIIAVNDTAFVDGLIGTDSVYQVLLNDRIHTDSANVNNVTLRVLIGSGRSDIVLDTLSGFLFVDSLTPGGQYTISYTISDTLNSQNIDTGLLVIRIGNTPIFAFGDSGSTNGYTGNLNLLNVLANDSLIIKGIQPGSVHLSIVQNPSNAGVVLNTGNGRISVFPGTPAGLYSMIYRICDTLNPSNCDTAIVKINVLAPNILATNDSASVNGFTGSPALINVLENDTFFQLPVLLGHVRLNMLTLSGNPGVSLDTTTGYVKVLANTLPGIYTMEYRISDTLNPANTDTALIYIQVKSGEIIANRDSAQVNGYKGLLNLVNILNNDTLNGSTPNANQVKIKELVSFGFPGLSLDTLTGWISVQPRTNAGSYNLRYLITDTTDINNTDTGEVSISVIAVGPVAMPDSAKTAAGLPVVISPLVNDSDIDTNIYAATMRITSQPAFGTAVADTIAQTITYTPNGNYTGYDTLYYAISDSGMVPVLWDTTYIVIHIQDTMRLSKSTISVLKCVGDTNGTASIEIIGGFPPYTITWNTIPAQTGPIAINLRAGNWQAMVVDTLFDTLFVNISVTGPTVPVAATAKLIEPKCNGGTNGSITLNPFGGTAPYTYLWSNGNSLKSISNIGAGTYSVTIIDTNGCSTKASFTLREPNAINITVDSIRDVYCKNSKDGIIAVIVSGGSGSYKYTWSNGDTLKTLMNVSNGNYSLIVKDTNNCSASANYSINYTRENCDDEVFIPQGFSPDGDGINDAYFIEGIHKYPDNYLRIYNRWGTLVFEERGYKNTWEGTSETGIGSNGEKLPTGTYFYILELIPGKEAKSGYLYISK